MFCPDTAALKRFFVNFDIYPFMCRYLEEKWKESGRKAMDFDDDILPLVRPRVPTQINGCDCGVYVLRYAKVSAPILCVCGLQLSALAAR